MTVPMPNLALALALAIPAPGPPAQEEAAPAAAANDPRMIASYERLVGFLAGLDGFDLAVRLDWEVEGDDPGQRGSNHYRFRLRRPGRFRIEVRPDDHPEPTLIVVSDGQTATTLYPPKSLYARAPLLDDPAEALERNPIVAISLSGSLIDTLMRPDLVDVVRSHATGGTFLGTEEVDGRELDRYSLSWRGDEEELWIGPESEPLPRKLVRILTVPTGADRATRLITTATLDWSLDADIPDEAFAVTLPPDATRVEDIYAALASGTAATLVGGPAPELDLDRLDGGKATLAFHAGRDVVVLDFWASWAAPCLDLLPRVAGLLDSYRDRGVVHYAINVGEEPEAIRQALEDLDLEAGPGLAVALDSGRATDAYGVTSIPTLVVIDKEGNVKAVHLGTGEAVLDDLRAELDALLDAP
jgi:thiol-disulfide isomerase/thioredoxin/outer membrane lipoprotein-sorting protein